ncbi:MAG: hypothetical protein WA705_11275 [Candidatus Ozemobacteraceae bacterium]
MVIVISACLVARFAPLFAFNGRDVTLINVAIPAIQAGLRAHRNKTPIGPAILQGIVGGLVMQRGFEVAAGVTDSDPWRAWRAKGMVNIGASLAESAGGTFRFRMDLGPIWVIADADGLRFRPGMHAVVAPLLNLRDGAKFDLNRSLRLGTAAFARPIHEDGTIGSRGALAYSNANNLVTNGIGSHAGHELVHVLQYRRDAFWAPSLGRLFPKLAEKWGDSWVDDTGWSLNWAVQSSFATVNGDDGDFKMLMEREAYYLTDSHTSSIH